MALTFPKLSVGFKILVAMLLLSLGGLAASCFVGLASMYSMTKSAMAGGAVLGAAAVNDSRTALIAQCRDELLSISKDQAYITSMKLERVASQVNAAARLFGIAQPSSDVFSFRSLLFSKKEEAPEDINAFSSISLAPGVENDDVKNDIKRLSQFHDIFKFMRYNNQHIKLLYIGTCTGVFLQHPWTMTPNGYDHRQRIWFKNAMGSDGIQWSAPYVAASDNGLVITCSRAIFDKRGKKIGVAAADISVDDVVNEFIRSQIERSGSAFLIDSAGRVMAKEGMSKVSIQWDQDYKSENLLESPEPSLREMVKRMIAGEIGTAKITLDGAGSYAGFAPVLGCGWSIAVVMPEDKILNPAKKTEAHITEEIRKVSVIYRDFIFQRVKVFMILSIFLLLAIVVTAAWLSKRITEPIVKLKEGAAKIGAGQLDFNVDIKTGDEMEELAKTFTKMAQDLQVYIRDLKETTAARQRIESDLKIAAEIQTSMLPRQFPPFPERVEELDLFASMEPAKEVGGDLYDFDFIKKDLLFICVGDVSGKGVPAALFMATARTMMYGLALQGNSPSDILLKTNNYLAKDNDACMFITVFCGLLNVATGELVCCDGGHNPPLLKKAEGESFEFMKLEKGLPLGTFEAKPGLYKSQTFKIGKGGTLFAYTDGVTEAMDPHGALFGEQRLVAAIVDAGAEASCQELVSAVRRAVTAHSNGAEQSDDITTLALKLKR